MAPRLSFLIFIVSLLVSYATRLYLFLLFCFVCVTNCETKSLHVSARYVKIYTMIQMRHHINHRCIIFAFITRILLYQIDSYYSIIEYLISFGFI